MWLRSLGQSCKHSFEERVFAEIQASKQALRLGEFAGLFRSFAVISYPHFSAVYVLVFSQWQIWQAAMQLLCLFFYYYYFAFIAP